MHMRRSMVIGGDATLKTAEPQNGWHDSIVA
jgi:hypothetical protein